jgi:hypothetical protein
MKFLQELQQQLEETYGAFTGLDVLDFAKSAKGYPGLGELIIEQQGEDLNLAMILDRDIFEAWECTQQNSSPANHRYLSVPFEEISHFVYLGFNHNRGRNVTPLEMEIQGEVDRILLAFHGPFTVTNEHKKTLLTELHEKPYTSTKHPRYEVARKTAAAFLRNLGGGNPSAWTRQDFAKLCEYFHNDLQGKMYLSGSPVK